MPLQPSHQQYQRLKRVVLGRNFTVIIGSYDGQFLHHIDSKARNICDEEGPGKTGNTTEKARRLHTATGKVKSVVLLGGKGEHRVRREGAEDWQRTIE